MANEISVSVEEAARRVGVGRDAVYAAINGGYLRSFKVGKRRLIAVAELERFVDRENRTQNMRPIPPQRRVAQ